MTETVLPSALAIDGGGSRCRFLLLKNGTCHAVTSGPSNVSTDFEGSVAALVAGVARLAAEAGLSEQEAFAVPAFVGLAGVTGPATITRLTKALPFSNAVYADDHPAALRGALGKRDGAIAHCGTGSFFAAEIDGTRRGAGGWGAVLGDEASAQWVGRRLLAVTLQCVDGFRPWSPLAEAALSRFDDAPGIVRFAADADPVAFGALAPMVTEGVAAADPIAIALMTEAATIVADSLTRIGWRSGLASCLTGGIGPHYAPFLPGDMQASLIPPEAEPIDGALALALDHASGSA